MGFNKQDAVKALSPDSLEIRYDYEKVINS